MDKLMDRRSTAQLVRPYSEAADQSTTLSFSRRKPDE
jgi:hypothetical protein